MADDLKQRDKEGINTHVKVDFADILAEPDALHSCDCIWLCSQTLFGCTRDCCYKLLTFLCGTCLSIAWGLDFALITFSHVWLYTPCLRDFTIACGFWQRCFGTCLTCLCVPCGESFGYIFSKINITNTNSNAKQDSK